jgi:hypothetical protein
MEASRAGLVRILRRIRWISSISSGVGAFRTYVVCEPVLSLLSLLSLAALSTDFKRPSTPERNAANSGQRA